MVAQTEDTSQVSELERLLSMRNVTVPDDPKIRFNDNFRLAYLTQYDTLLIKRDEKDRDKALEKCIKYAAEIGYDDIEVAAHIPDPDLRDPTGDTLNLCDMEWTTERRDKIRGWLETAGVGISSLGCYDNMLHEDPIKRAKNIDHLKKVIDAASDLGVEYVGTFAGRNMKKSGTDQWDEFEEVFVDLVKYAKSKDVKLMFENCPMEGWAKGIESNVQSISHSPENWLKMFEIMKKNDLDGWLGLNYDPSHLVWQDIDPIEVLYALHELGHSDKIFHVHAKDIQIDRAKQRAQGNLGQGEPGWNLPYGHRVPGVVPFEEGGQYGTPNAREYRESVYWQGFISALRNIGYKGAISFEHEDHDNFKNVEFKDPKAAEAAKANPELQRLANSALRKDALRKAYQFLSNVAVDTKTSNYDVDFNTYRIERRQVNRAA